MDYPVYKKVNFIETLLLSILCFFLMCLNEGSSVKMTASILLTLVFLKIFVEDDNWIKPVPLAYYSLFTFVILNAIMVFFAMSTNLAYLDFLKLLVPFLIMTLCFCFRKSKKQIAEILVITVTISSFLSIDLLGTRVFTTIFQRIISIFTEQYTIMYGVEAGSRMLSLFSNPNIFAGMAGVAVFFALDLVINSESVGQSRFFLFCLFLNSLAFILVFSLGATFTIALAFILYLILEKKERKSTLFVLMLETFFITLFTVFPIFSTSFQEWEQCNLYPLLFMIYGGVCLCTIHEYFGEKLVKILEEKQTSSRKFMLIFLMIIFCFLVTAFHWTGSATMEENSMLKRSSYLKEGEYSLEINADEELFLVIESQSREETVRHTRTILYEGSGTNINFMVPTDSIVAHFTFYSEEKMNLLSATLSNGSELNLNYILLPEFISFRLQGVLANENFIQRFIFFQDGLKLFMLSPILGLGMGSFESGLFRTQSFYYETKYAHNHYIQILLESGIVGLILFLITIFFLYKGLAKPYQRVSPSSPCHLCVLFFSLSHAFVELIWSSGFYQIIIFLAFSIFMLEEDGIPFEFRKKRKAVKMLEAMLLYFTTLTFTLLNLHLNAAILVNSSVDDEEFLGNLETAIKLDFFGQSNYMASYINSVGDSDEEEQIRLAESYIPKMKAENSNISSYYVAEFYLKQGDFEKAMYYLKIYVNNAASHPEIWNSTFDLMHQYLDITDDDTFIQGNRELYEMFQRWNEDNIGEVFMREDILYYLNRIFGDNK